MSKITITAAVKLVPVSESTLRRDVKSGKVSSETDRNGHKIVDTAELVRVYPGMKAVDNHETPPMQAVDNHEVVALLEAHVADLKAQLNQATAEKSQVLDMLKLEQEKSKLLMISTTEKRSWFSRLWTPSRP